MLRNATGGRVNLLSVGLKPLCRPSGIGPMRPRRNHGLAWLVLCAWTCHILALLPALWAAPRTKRLAAAAVEKSATSSLDSLRELKPIHASQSKCLKHSLASASFHPNLPYPTIIQAHQRPRWLRRRLHGAAAEPGAGGLDLGASQRPAAAGVGGGAGVGRGAGAGDESRGWRVFLGLLALDVPRCRAFLAIASSS